MLLSSQKKKTNISNVQKHNKNQLRYQMILAQSFINRF